MIGTLITLAAVAAGAPLAVWAASREPATPRTWRHHTELAISLALLVGGVVVAVVAGGVSGG